MRARFAVSLLVVGVVVSTGGALRGDSITRAVPCRISLLDGGELGGALVRLVEGRLVLADRERGIAFHELRELSFELPEGDKPKGTLIDPASRAFIQFDGGEILGGRVLGADSTTFRLRVRGLKTDAEPAGQTIGEIAVPLTALRAFRLREAHAEDAIFEETLAQPRPKSDLVFVRRDDRLVKIPAVFRGLDDEFLTLEYKGAERQIKRSRVLGVVFSPVAGAAVESGDEGTLVLVGGGRLPAVLAGVSAGDDEPRIEVTVHGKPWRVPLRFVDHIAFASDRIRFLSDLDPARVKEIAFVDSTFPYRRDLSVGGSPIRVGGVEYRKGLGVHSRSALDFALEEGFASFVARVGIDDAMGERGHATVRVLGNGRKIWEANVKGGAKPVDAVVSILGIRTLTLEVDFGPDGLDVADHVDWAEARIVKPAKTKRPDKPENTNKE